MQIFRHKQSGVYLRLLVMRESGINTFLEVSDKNEPIVKLRPWSAQKPETQRRIIKGFDKLKEHGAINIQ